MNNNYITYGKCSKCNVITWPTLGFCTTCLGKTTRHTTQQGVILIHSKFGNEIFCVVEFEQSIRILGKLINPPKLIQIDQKVRITDYHNSKLEISII